MIYTLAINVSSVSIWNGIYCYSLSPSCGLCASLICDAILFSRYVSASPRLACFSIASAPSGNMLLITAKAHKMRRITPTTCIQETSERTKRNPGNPNMTEYIMNPKILSRSVRVGIGTAAAEVSSKTGGRCCGCVGSVRWFNTPCMGGYLCCTCTGGGESITVRFRLLLPAMKAYTEAAMIMMKIMVLCNSGAGGSKLRIPIKAPTGPQAGWLIQSLMISSLSSLRHRSS
jgi:hypothetical protein